MLDSVLLLIEAVFTGIVAVCRGIPYDTIQKTVIDSITAIISPILILLLIGGLVSGWIMCGTVPTLIYAGLKAIDPQIFLIVTFLMCSLTSMLNGFNNDNAHVRGGFWRYHQNAGSYRLSSSKNIRKIQERREDHNRLRPASFRVFRCNRQLLCDEFYPGSVPERKV